MLWRDRHEEYYISSFGSWISCPYQPSKHLPSASPFDSISTSLQRSRQPRCRPLSAPQVWRGNSILLSLLHPRCPRQPYLLNMYAVRRIRFRTRLRCCCLRCAMEKLDFNQSHGIVRGLYCWCGRRTWRGCQSLTSSQKILDRLSVSEYK